MLGKHGKRIQDKQEKARFRSATGKLRKRRLTQLKIKGSSLDARLRNSLLLDVKLQRRLTAVEFRAFINLTVWTVSLVSDGVFNPDDAEMVANLDRQHIQRFCEFGLVEFDDAGNYRLHPDYWQWQSSIAELEKMEQRREADKERQKRYRAKGE